MTAKTTAQKLQIKPATKLWLSDVAYLSRIEPLPENATTTQLPDRADVAIIVADDAETLRKTLAHYATTIVRPPIVWVAYPKANRSDINRDTIWPIMGEYGLRANGQVAIDDTWSALRFRLSATPSTPGRPG